ncbi:MAG: ferrochelatase [Bdellovibrio sp.]|nr:ferrochelatase [Bdellovibrio sp.]
MATEQIKTGILLLNFGGPWNLKEVKPFLYRVFSDPNILVKIPSPLRKCLAFLIAQIKGAYSVRAYKTIGGCSPQLHWTKLQAMNLENILNNRFFKISIGMRASSPSISEALTELKGWGAEQLILLPLFPQYSTTTTGSCFEETYKQLKKLKWQPVIKEICSWPDHPDYISLLIQTLNEAMQKAKTEWTKDHNIPVHIIFSAHSLPLAIVKRGDPYSQEINQTFLKLQTYCLNSLSTPCSLAFQSRNGRLPWLEPYLENELIRLAKLGSKRLIIIPISFVSDHIETLWELDLLYSKIAKENGIEQYIRARTFNDDIKFGILLYTILLKSSDFASTMNNEVC